MSTSLPETQLGVLSTASSRKLQKFPVPRPAANEVLVRNVAVGSNPKDWKVPLRFEGYSAIEGNDVAGTVAAVGAGVTEFKLGDRVGAFSKMGTQDNKYGAYAEYTVAPAPTTFPLGPHTSFEDAAALPLAVMTAVIGLFKRLALPEPPATGTAPPSEKAIIIYGASTSVGAYAVQLAKRAGLFVVGVAGASAEYAKRAGADVVVNYKEEKNLESAMVTAVGARTATHGYDAVCAGESTQLLARVLTQTTRGTRVRITFVGHLSAAELAAFPAGVDAERTGVNTAYGADVDFAAKYYRLIARWVDENSFKPSDVRIIPGGLAGVDEGVRMLKAGEVHAEKLVYRIADTPGVEPK